MRNANLVENYPGFPNGVSGEELVSLFTAHLRRWNVPVIMERVLELDYNDGIFLIRTPNKIYNAEIVIVATGTTPKKPEFVLDLHPELLERVVYEVAEIRNISCARILVVGAGDAAFDYALTLLSLKNDVIIINRGTKIRALPLLVNRAKVRGVQYYEKTRMVEVMRGYEKPLRVILRTDDREWDVEVDYILVAIGRVPNIDFYSTNLRDVEKKLIAEGKLYVIGDAKGSPLRQASIAVSDGVMAATKIGIRTMEGNK